MKNRYYDALKLALIITLIIIYFILYFFTTLRSENKVYMYKIITGLNMKERTDIPVIFDKGIVEILNHEYKISLDEYLFCLIGDIINGKVYVKGLVKQGLFYKESDIAVPIKDPACQVENSIGSIHSHPSGSCEPSVDDVFSWGARKNPEPIINAIQCDIDNFYIMLMPRSYESLDFRPLKWEVAK